MSYDREKDVENSVGKTGTKQSSRVANGESITFLDTIAGLLVEPRETVAALFSQKPPLFVPSLLITFVLVIFLPIVIQTLRWEFLVTRLYELGCLAFILSLTALFFIILERLVLVLWGEPVTWGELSAAFVYSCTPLLPIVLCYYAIDLIRYGKLATVTYVITGVPPAGDWSAELFPLAHILAKILFLVVFYFSLRSIRRSGPVTTFIIVLFSSIPFYLGLIAAISISEVAFPGSTTGVKGLLESLIAPLHS